MRILVTGFTKNYGGIETFIYTHYRAIKKINPSIIMDIISTSDNPAYKQEILEMGGNFYKISKAKYRSKQSNELKDIFLNSSVSYDVIWCNKCDLSDINYMKQAYKYKVPMRILHSHSSKSLYTGIKKCVFNVLHYTNRRFVTKYVTDYWACSDLAANWLFTKDIIHNHKYTFIPNAINIDKFKKNILVRYRYREKLNIQNKLIIGFVGMFTYAKNPFFVLDIFEEIHKMNKNSILLWAGSGSLKVHVEKKIKAKNLEENVILLGIRHDIDSLMQAMDCLLLPSRFEGLPIVAIEAQSCGLHVFASSEGISKQTEITNSFSFLSLQQNAYDWANTILKTDLSHVNNSDKIIKSKFEININADNIYNCFLDASLKG